MNQHCKKMFDLVDEFPPNVREALHNTLNYFNFLDINHMQTLETEKDMLEYINSRDKEITEYFKHEYFKHR